METSFNKSGLCSAFKESKFNAIQEEDLDYFVNILILTFIFSS